MPDTLRPRRLSAPLLFFGASFLLHLLWENLQAPLYEGFTSFRQHFGVCFRATITGDMLFMLTIYAALAVVHRDPLWVANRETYAHPTTWLIALLIGTLLAVSFELWAVHVDHRWQYAEAMPLMPIVHVGLTPVLQMLLVPPAVLLLTSRLSRSL